MDCLIILIQTSVIHPEICIVHGRDGVEFHGTLEMDNSLDIIILLEKTDAHEIMDIGPLLIHIQPLIQDFNGIVIAGQVFETVTLVRIDIGQVFPFRPEGQGLVKKVQSRLGHPALK